MAETCVNCQKPKANLKCGICDGNVCKKCAQFIEEDHFNMMPNVADEFQKGRYCPACFDEKIQPVMTRYDSVVEKAKRVHVFYEDDAAETRLFKRNQKPVSVDNCKDNYEVLMKLAFIAIEAGCNTLVDVQTSSERVDLGGYQTSKFKGRGTPVKIDGYKPNRKSRIIGRGD